jgi:hypothetical protein
MRFNRREIWVSPFCKASNQHSLWHAYRTGLDPLIARSNLISRGHDLEISDDHAFNAQ